EHDTFEPQRAVLDLGDVRELGRQARDAAERGTLLALELLAVGASVAPRVVVVERRPGTCEDPGDHAVGARVPLGLGPRGVLGVLRRVGDGSRPTSVVARLRVGLTHVSSQRGRRPGSHGRPTRRDAICSRRTVPPCRTRPTTDLAAPPTTRRGPAPPAATTTSRPSPRRRSSAVISPSCSPVARSRSRSRPASSPPAG